MVGVRDPGSVGGPTTGAVAAAGWDGYTVPSRGYLESNFPCRAACPVGTNAGGYVALIAKGHFEAAYLLARRPNPFASVCGRICAHPCEAACRRSAIDAPLNIRALKRVVTEKFGCETHVPFEQIKRNLVPPRPPAERPGKVAVIGAGPAGLSCAHDLALMGHQVVVYDAAPVAGGMMRLGIPEYRLPRELLDCEIDFIRSLGVELRLGVEIGTQPSFAELRRTHDAVFLATGCRKGRLLELPGKELTGVLTAVDFLAAANLGTPLTLGERIVVIGGGNVAFDAARSARRFGGTSEPDEEHHNLLLDTVHLAARLYRREVTVVALEGKEEMPADPRELEEADEEGVRILHRHGPKQILGKEGRVVGLETLDVARVYDEARRFSPVLRPGTERTIPCDTVILATGQVADLSFLGPDHGLKVTPRQTVEVDRQSCSTSVPGIYAGGDLAFGPRIVIEAVADGRRAALAIDAQITGRGDRPVEYVAKVLGSQGYDHPFALGDYEKIPRARLRTIHVDERVRQAEVERPLDDDEAINEAKRCLHCWVNTIFDSVEANGSACIQCGGCVDVCPEQCIELVSAHRLSPGPEVDPNTSLPYQAPLAWLGGERGAALLKDESACIRCGLCARRCPAQVITMQAHYREDEADLMALADRGI